MLIRGLSISRLFQRQIGVLTEAKEELEDELESARALIKRRDTEISQLRQQNEQLRVQLDGGEVQFLLTAPTCHLLSLLACSAPATQSLGQSI